MIDPSKEVRRALAFNGLLLVQDQHVLNIVTLVTGQTLRGSWWSHPKGRLIFALLTELGEDPDVLFTKLLHTKVTLVHRQLWSAFLAVVSAGETWQVRGLSAAARRLLASASESERPIIRSGPAVKELEGRLLAHTQQCHTDMGRHELEIRPWAAWARSAKVKPLASLAVAKKRIEDAAIGIGADLTALPWRSKKHAAT